MEGGKEKEAFFSGWILPSGKYKVCSQVQDTSSQGSGLSSGPEACFAEKKRSKEIFNFLHFKF